MSRIKKIFDSLLGFVRLTNKRLLRLIQSSKEIFSASFLLAFVSAIIGASFFLGQSLGEKIAIGDVKNLTSKIEDMEDKMNALGGLLEVSTYNINKNNVEALEKINEILLDEKLDSTTRFLAYENKARVLVRNGNSDFNIDVLDVGNTLVSKFPDEYNGYHWRGLSTFRIAMARVKNGDLPMWLVQERLQKVLIDFEKSIELFPRQIKDRINLIEVLIVMDRYDHAKAEIQDAKDIVKLKKDFHVLILDYLESLCNISLSDNDFTDPNLIAEKIRSFPTEATFNYTAFELQTAFDAKKITPKKREALQKLLKLMEVKSDKEQGN